MCCLMMRRPPRSTRTDTLVPHTTLFRAYLAPVNTGVPSGLDLDGSGTVGGEGRDRGNDAWGYGLHPGQYGMLVLSRYPIDTDARSEEHTSELQSLMRISYAVFCLKKKSKTHLLHRARQTKQHNNLT